MPPSTRPDRTPELIGIIMGIVVTFLLAVAVTCYLHGRG